LVAKKFKLAAVLIDRGAPFVRLPTRSRARQFPEQVDGSMWPDQFFVSKMKMLKGVTARWSISAVGEVHAGRRLDHKRDLHGDNQHDTRTI
jgi:hypothetical protein